MKKGNSKKKRRHLHRASGRALSANKGIRTASYLFEETLSLWTRILREKRVAGLAGAWSRRKKISRWGERHHFSYNRLEEEGGGGEASLLY